MVRQEDEDARKHARMHAHGSLFGGVGSILSGIGGLIGGVVAAFGLIYAQPDLVTVVVPVHTLERVIERAQAEGASEPHAVETTAPTAPAPPTGSASLAPVQALGAPQSLGGAVAVELISIADTSSALVVNVRVTNGGGTPIMIAGRALGSFGNGDFVVSDPMGGSCSWRGNVSEMGSLPQAYGTPPINVANYRPIGAGQSVTATVIFQKNWCTTQPTAGQPLTFSGTFVVIENDTPRFSSASFEGLTPSRPN